MCEMLAASVPERRKDKYALADWGEILFSFEGVSPKM